MNTEYNFDLDRKFISILLNMLNEGIDVTVTTTGNSMRPLWKNKRDSVVLTCCDYNNLKKYDVVLYRGLKGKVILHRIVEVNNDSYTLCGDGNTVIEYGIPKENVLAIVKSFTRKDKSYTCTDFRYIMYSFIWVSLFPKRHILLRLYHKMRGVIWRRIQR